METNRSVITIYTLDPTRTVAGGRQWGRPIFGAGHMAPTTRTDLINPRITLFFEST